MIQERVDKKEGGRETRMGRRGGGQQGGEGDVEKSWHG